MKRFFLTCFAAAALTGVAVFAGALTLEVGNPDANNEAKALHAVLIARVTACHEPGKSAVTASVVQLIDGKVQRTKLDVAPMTTPGTFAIVGTLPSSGAIELAVTNPEYKNYEPRVLIRRDANGIEWASLKRFYSTPPTAADVKAALE